MLNITSKINKLIAALNFYGYIYLVNKEQIYSKKKEKVCSIYKLFQLLPVEEYNKLYPEDKKDTEKYEKVKVELINSFKQIDILLELVDIYKKVGVTNG